MGRWLKAAALGVASLGLTGCNSLFSSLPPPAVAPAAAFPPTLSSAQFIGAWGLASYHNDADRARTEKEAKAQCNKPYVIAQGPNGGLMMHLADQATPSELALKGADAGRNYIGPANEPAGGADDREIVEVSADSFTTKWVDADTAARYGTMVYARCRGAGKKA
ncbi:MAG TPA: hypothetical protein VKU03_03395 [Roseiarcus sp.]|nr:hypothetical protein [Roseiarcus sp.]